MKRRVEKIARDLSDRLAAWEGVDTITLAEFAEMDPTDPYFFMSFDVFYRGSLPDLNQRIQTFSDAGAFESSNVSSKDRFIIDSVPVRVEYKDIDRIDSDLRHADERLWIFRQSGTYIFYRLSTYRVLHAKSDWIEKTREKLKNLPKEFWKALEESSFAAAEHYLSDLQAAVIRDDWLFYIISMAGYLKNLSSVMFVLNRRFEPSGRDLYQRVLELPDLPENFRGRFYSIVHESDEFPPSRKQELAELLLKSILPMMSK
ncbi:DUF4037 domain-containing protein [Marispirochaeta aestuarii]|uniref:DUF4037 domain-containing protein n=1 Tax=Marispirochaeta aestuarii TaxID=1963862 RepID=UPI0029C924AD|nr:DUF4037 domain-containing protein [Marispirochaeta aestuarii]